MAELQKSVDLSTELTEKVLVRGALTLEKGEFAKVRGLLKKGLENLIAQGDVSNRVAYEFKQLIQTEEKKMKDLTEVKKFYGEVVAEATFDYVALAAEFIGHDIFANPPRLHKTILPFLGEVELGLIAIAKEGRCADLWFDCAIIAIDDGKYSYNSEISFRGETDSSSGSCGV